MSNGGYFRLSAGWMWLVYMNYHSFLPRDVNWHLEPSLLPLKKAIFHYFSLTFSYCNKTVNVACQVHETLTVHTKNIVKCYLNVRQLAHTWRISAFFASLPYTLSIVVHFKCLLCSFSTRPMCVTSRTSK